MSIIVRRPWPRQPQTQVGYDRAALQKFGICGGFVAGQNRLYPEGTDGLPLTSTTGTGAFIPNYLISGYGIAATFVDGAGTAERFLLRTGSPLGRSFTIMARVITAANGVFGRAGTTLPLWRNAGTFDMRIQGTDYTNAGTWSADTWYDIDIVGSPSSCQLFVDGVLTINGAAAANTAIGASMEFGYDGSGGGGGVIAGMYYLFANRPLGEGDRAAIRSNPWQLFAPLQQRIWVPSAAAGGAPTLSDLQAVSITSSSVQATYDYAF